MLSIPAGALLITLVLLSSMGFLAWLFPTETPDARKRKL